ncbi:MAG: NYN domain-containing protein [Endomicrobium sp.]|jgi:uncharacterized LabA/DUF88 family protein|nr:NYN domain-containing protein [Endomicrobium sp.]
MIANGLTCLQCATAVIDTSFEKLVGIKYFTALSWKPESRERQTVYIKALLFQCRTNIEIIYGQFKSKTKFCPLCSKKFTAHEEKLTDVNLAIHLFENASKNTFDEAIIVSADSDLIPPIKAIKGNFPEKIISVLPPINNPAIDLINNAHKRYKMKSKTLLSSLLPNPCGTLKMPKSWQYENYMFDKATDTTDTGRTL